MALDDYGSLIQSGMNIVPDFNRQLGLQAQTEALRAETQQRQAETQALTQKQARAQMFQQDLSASDGSPHAVSALIMKYPELADELKKGYDVQDKAARDADLTTSAEIYSAANSGNWELAKKLAHQRADAEKAAGHNDPNYDAAIESMDRAAAGDKNEQKGVLNLLGTHLAAVTGAEHFGTVYGALKGGYTLEAGATRFDENGNIAAQSPFLKTADGGILERDAAPTGKGGDTPVAGGVVARSHGYTPRARDGGDNSDAVVDNKIAALSKAVGVDPDTPMNPQQFAAFAQALPATEGATNTLTGKNRNPGGIKDGAFAKAQPGYAGSWKGYAVFKDDQSGTAAMQKLLTNRFYNRGQQSIRDIIEGRPKGQASAAPASAPAASSTGAPPGFHTLVPGKPKDVPAGYRYKADGSLEAIPGGPADQGAQDALDPATKTFYAQQMIAGAPMPPLGMGKAAAKARQDIMKEVARIAGTEGLSGADQAVQMSHYKAATQALKTLETQAGTIEQNEKTALMNGQQFIDRSKELSVQTRFPIVNSVTQSYLRHTGDPTIAAMDAAWNTFTTEYAKVVAGSPSGAGTLSDSARHESQEIMRGNYNYQQKLSAFRQMQADMANRMAAIHQTITKKYDTLTKNPRKAAEIASQTDLGSVSAPKSEGKTIVRTGRDKSGKRVVQYSDGTIDYAP